MRVAVLGATGMVGREVLRCLETSGLPVEELRPLASERSAGSRVTYAGVEHIVARVSPRSFADIDVVLASAGAEASRRWLPVAVAAGAVCIDNSSAFRLEDDVPLVVPEVNPQSAFHHPRGIIANPNCSTIQLVMVLKPLLDAVGLLRVRVSTYQGVSGAGQAACVDLVEGTRQHLAGDAEAADPITTHVFNVVPWIDVAVENGESREEWKMRVESRKILGADLPLHATCARVPVFVGHSEAVWVETEQPLEPDEARRLLASAPGVELLDDPARGGYPTPRLVAGDDRVFVGRVRRDPTVEHGLALWVVADNLRKGAAANAVAILGLLSRQRAERLEPAAQTQ